MKRGLSKQEVDKHLQDLAKTIVDQFEIKGRAKTTLYYKIFEALQMAAWYGAQTVIRSGEMGSDRLFDNSWLRKRKKTSDE